jgi:hypothetical protein
MSILRFCHPILLAAITVLALAQEPAAPRLLPIPQRESGYSNFDTLVIARRSDYEAFLKTTALAVGWNSQTAFEAALTEAKLDFGREALVLLRHTEGSGSVRIVFAKPEVKDRRVVCRIERTEPEKRTDDMAHYCFAIVVTTADVAEIELQVQGRPSIILPIRLGKDSP